MKERKPTRWNRWDYSQPAYYFITICTHERKKIFGKIIPASVESESVESESVGQSLRLCPTDSDSDTDSDTMDFDIFFPMILNENGMIVLNCWYDLPNYYTNCKLDQWVIMPNHIHAIVQITQQTKHTLYHIIGSLKSFSTRRIHETNGDNDKIWQTSFHDRIIRTDEELENIRYYIKTNPMKWLTDEFFQGNI